MSRDKNENIGINDKRMGLAEIKECSLVPPEKNASVKAYIFIYNVIFIKSDFLRLKSFCQNSKFILISSNYCLRHLSTNNRSSFDSIHQIDRDFHHIDYDNVKKIVNGYVEKYGAAHIRLLTNEESTQIGCAKIREFYGIPGDLLDEILPFVNKVISKKRLKNVVSIPEFILFDKLRYAEEKESYIVELTEELGFPMFVKPIDMVSSIEAYKICDFSQLKEVADKMLIIEHDFEIDEFIDGDLFHCDCILENGIPRVFMAGEYAFHLAKFSQGFPMGSMPVTDKRIYDDLFEFTNKVLQTLRIKSGALHLEVFLEKKSKRFVFLEVSARTPGAMLPKSYEVQFGINIEEWHYLSKMGLLNDYDLIIADKFSGWISFPTVSGMVKDIKKPEIEIKYEFIEHVSIGQVIRDSESLLDVSCSVIFWDKDIQKVRASFEKLKKFRPLETENAIPIFSHPTSNRLQLDLENHFEIMEELFNSMPYVFWKDKNGRYRGCNLNQAKAFHFTSVSDFIGKTIFELLPDMESAKMVEETDNAIMSSGKMAVLEETLAAPEGVKTYFSQKQPLHDNDGAVVGMLGFSIDITKIKEQELLAKEERERLEKEKYQLEIDNYKLLAEEQEKFTKIANQVSHDIRSPLSSLLMILKGCTQIPEPQRIALREAATSARDIANHLLNQYKKKDSHSLGAEGNSLLVSTALLELLTAKKYQYEELDVQFDCHFEDNTHFAFIKSEFSDFRRMISNLLNNAVDALEEGKGTVRLDLSADDDQVQITIQDTGKGMSPELISKIMSKTAFTEGKNEGHGIGLTQVWETLDKSQGQMHIDSILGKGSNLILTFPRAGAPRWLAEEIILKPDDTVIILDDDASIHGAWQTRFESILDQSSGIKRRHFREGKEALEFITSLSSTEKNKLFLLSDYELLKQELNGLNVIEKCGVSRSILVTSHYADPIVQEQASKTGTKILPKELASEVPIRIVDTNKIKAEDNTVNKVDIVLVEDDEDFSDSIANNIFSDKVVDQYLKPEDLLKNIHRYSKDTKIYLDNKYNDSWLTGIDTAKELHDRGYEQLYLLSGSEFSQEELPPYLKHILKGDLDRLEQSKNEEEPNEEWQNEDEENEEVYAVVVDDNKSFVRALQFGGFGDHYTEAYFSPEELLENVHKYPKDMRFFLDNNFIGSKLTGIDTAKKLHELGYTRINILSGESFLEAPSYVTVIVKGSAAFYKLTEL